MTEIVLIGSRALNYHLNDRKIDEKTTDYDFIATQSGALVWLATLKDGLKLETVNYPFDRKMHNVDIERDIKNWKHMDGKIATEIYNEQLSKLVGLTKIKGHTENLKFEIEIAQPGSSAAFILEIMGKTNSSEPERYKIASLEILEAIKTSHIIFPYNFRKHMADLNLMRSKLGRERNYTPERSYDLDKLIIHRRLEHYLRLGVPGSHINLNKMNEDFLENEVTLYVDKYIKHDDLHLRVMIDGKTPAYDELRVDKNKAMMSKILFDEASSAMRLNCVREEAMTIALERYLLPDREKDAQTAYTKALIRVCTTLTKGWFREFAVNVYYLVEKLETDLMKIKTEIRKEHAERMAIKELEVKRLAESIQSMAEIRQSSYSNGLAYRIRNLFPLIFSDENELELAQQMAKYVTRGEFGYRCKFLDEGLDFVFRAETNYEYINGGWCDCFNRWYAYIIAIDYQTHENNRDDLDYMYLKYEDIAFNYGKDYKDPIRLAFSMDCRADDSDFNDPRIENLYTTSLDELEEKSTNLLVTGDFLMRFILAVTYPAQFKSDGQSAMPSSETHFLYEIWRNRQ